MTDTASTTSSDTLADVLGRISWEMDRGIIPAGDQATLRRGWLGPAFWRIAVRHLEPAGLLPGPGAPWRRKTEDRWAVILQGMAQSPGLHRPGMRFGQALVDAGVSEARLLRLLRATGDPLHRSLRAVIHQLASQGQPFDWKDPASLVLYEEIDHGVRVQRRIARDYYRAQSMASA